MISKKSIAMIGMVVSSALILSACGMYGGSTDTGTNQTGESPQSQAIESPITANVITYSDGGFSPKQITVEVGEKVEFMNNADFNVQVNSAMHPTHELYPELNIGVIAPGESKSVTFTASGIKTYHNHLNVSENGQIMVE